MSKPFIPLTAFTALLLLTIPFPFNFSTSVVPGWHTTIWPPHFIWATILTIVLLFVVLGYWLLKQKAKRISWTFFTLHFLLTLPAIIFIKLPSLFLEFDATNQEAFLKSLSLRTALIPWAWALFFVGQITFVTYFIILVKARKIISNFQQKL